MRELFSCQLFFYKSLGKADVRELKSNYLKRLFSHLASTVHARATDRDMRFQVVFVKYYN